MFVSLFLLSMQLIMKHATFLVMLGCVGLVSAFAPKLWARRKITAAKSSSIDDYSIDEERRLLLNLIVVGPALVTISAFAIPYIAFFVPPGTDGRVGGSPAKDALGNDLFVQDYLAAKPAGDRSLVQGLRGDATYLIVREDNTLESYGLNAICTHLGCVVPWVPSANKFQCPCHGSQYASDGSLVRGPAPLPLELAHVDTDGNGKIVLISWTEEDFRTGAMGWWN